MPESWTDPVELVRQGYPRMLHAAKRLMDGDEQPVLVAQVDGVHQLAVDVELQLPWETSPNGSGSLSARH